MGAGAEAIAPTAAGVELADEVEQARSDGFEVRRELGIRIGVRASMFMLNRLRLSRLYTAISEAPAWRNARRSRRDPSFRDRL